AEERYLQVGPVGGPRQRGPRQRAVLRVGGRAGEGDVGVPHAQAFVEAVVQEHAGVGGRGDGRRRRLVAAVGDRQAHAVLVESALAVGRAHDQLDRAGGVEGARGGLAGGERG